MFSLAYKKDVEFLLIKTASKKVSRNNVDISTREITSKKVCGNNVDFSTSEITSKKVRGNNMDFSTSEITLKKYVEVTWKFVEIWSSMYRRNIDVESTLIRCGVPLGSSVSDSMTLLEVVVYFCGSRAKLKCRNILC